jgi:ribosomal protein L6P/L9E
LLSEKKYKKFFFSFLNSFINFLKTYNKIYSKKLILKGLGFKMNLVEIDNLIYLKLKLGYSHIIEFPVLKNKLTVFIKKNKLILRSNDIFFLNNFCKKIKNLKNPNIYNGKGFWYKKEKFFLKTFKKSK